VYEFIPSPDVDFNEDGIVTAKDVTVMVDHWHADNALYDIAPSPSGNGIFIFA
jgi:hypothetical protein